MSITKNYTLVVEGLTSEGEGFVTINEKLIRIGRYLPGDKINIELNNETKKPGSVELLEPSKDRVKSDCFYHGACGGCDLLELSEKARKKEKAAMIKRALARIPNSEKAEVENFCASKEIIRYMPRVRMHQSQNREERVSGFLASENFDEKIPGGVVPITSCALLMPALNKRIVATRKILDTVPIMLESLSLMCSSSTNSDRVVGHAVMQKGKTARFFIKDLNKIMRSANLKGLTVADHNNKIKEVLGETSVTGLIAPTVKTGPFESEASFFVQGNIYQNSNLINKVVEYAAPTEKSYIIEGFAGAGNLTLALAEKGARIDAVESHPGAVRSGIKNINKSGFKNVKLHEGNALKDLTKFGKADILVLDPPRTGTPGIASLAEKINPDKIILVFCDLEAMVKDCKALINTKNYKLEKVAGFDLYPRTHHVEAVVLMTKK